MPFSSVWDMVLHPWVHMLLTQVTPAHTSQKRVIPVVVCGQSAHLKWRRCGGQMKSVGSSSLGLQMQLANLATSTVASAARMFQFWPTAHMKSWDTSKVSSISSVTSDWEWRHLVGGYGILRETPLQRVSWSTEGNPFFEVLWLFAIGSILLLRIWLWMILELWIPSYQSLRRRHCWLKYCDWVGFTSWFISCGHNLL